MIKNKILKILKIEVFYEIVDFFWLDMCSKPIFCSKVAQKGKICSGLLEPQKVAPNAKSCSKADEDNRERPSSIYSACAYTGSKFFNNGLVT